MNALFKSGLVFIVAVIFFSCADVRKTIYFADQKDGIISNTSIAAQTYIRPNDILSIAVSSANTASAAIFNTPNTTAVTAATPTGSTTQSPGYLVTREGFIQFPLLGDIKAAGLTTDQLRLFITGKLKDKKLLVDPIVAIRLLNFKVSVLGEVANPTVITVPSEKISLLEALGLAGDITIYGRKDNVTVIREENGEKKIQRLDLNSGELFRSPYYYLQPNDVVYVAANDSKVASSSRGRQTLPVILSALSIIVILTQVVLRK